MSENIKQRYNATTQTTTSNPFRNIDLSDGSPALDGDVIVFGGVCDTTGAAVDFATQTTLAAIAVDAAAMEVLLGTIDTDTGAIATSAASIDGKITACNTGAVVVSSSALPSGAATESTLGTLSAKFATGTVIGDVNLGATDNAVLDAIAASAAAIQAGQLADGHNVTIDNASIAVTGTFWQATQPVSGTVAVTGTQTDALTDTQLRATAVPVSGTVTAELSATDNAVLDAIAASVASVDGKTTAINTGAVVVSSSALPSGASTAAKQPALGTAGTASADVITVQGITSMTPLLVNGSGVTQPVSGTFWQATQPVSAASLPLPSGASTEATLSSLNGKVTACNTGAVVISSALPAGTNNIGDVDVISCALPAGAASLAEQQEQTTNLSNIQGFSENIQTAVQLIDDAIVAVDAVGTSAKVMMGGAIRDDALSTLTPVEGDAVNLRTDANGALWVKADGAALESGGNLAAIAGTVKASGGAAGTFISLGAYDAVDSSTMLPLQVDPFANNALYVSIASTLNAIDVNAVGPAAHDSAVTSYRPVTISGRASAAAPSDVSADNDATYLWALRNGSLVTNLAVGGTLVTASAGLPVAGGIAHDGADSGNPHKVGARAKGSLSAITLVAADDRTDLFAGLDGIQIVRPHSPLEDLVSGVAAITDGSSTSVIAAQGAGVKTYITSVTIANTSATAVTVDLRDGTAGSVKWTFPVPADTAGVVHTFPTPLGFSANTIVAADPSAAASTVTVSLSGFRSKV